jgi:outer membrane protein OmpA-like peptidoglycan-associated protein
MLAIGYANAQEQLSLKQQADRLFNRYEYFKSLAYYLKLAKGNKPNIKVVERIAECYRNINLYTDAEAWYAKAVADAKVNRITHYYYAEVLQRNQKFDVAKQQYQLYYLNDSNSLARKLADCDSARLWLKQPSRYTLTNAGTINSPYSDWGAVYDGKTGLIFTSDRDAGYSSTDNRTGNNWFKLYQTDLAGHQIKQLILSGNDNDFKDDYHVGPIALNSTGDTAYVTVTTDIALSKLAVDKQPSRNAQKLSTRRLQLVMAAKSNGQWLIFGQFPYNNIQQYSIGNAALSPNGKLLYFSSDMPGGLGKTDIWYCEKQRDGSWSKPVNCGKTINTPNEDSFPYLDDGGTLYYSSKGLPGMGGYDIYTAKGEKETWTTPQNLKYPINTTSDDFYLITHNSLNGYLSSNRDGGQGNDDIYSFGLKPDTLPIKTVMVTVVPKPAIDEVKPDLTIRTIYYDLDKSFIRPDAALELDNLIAILNQHPEFKVQLSSYTDSRASYLYNIALSQRRAKAAAAYLVKHGIPVSRLIANGYGKTHLVNQCADYVNCTEAEHQINRRTEFKLIRAPY